MIAPEPLIAFACRACRERVEAPARLAGRMVRCPACRDWTYAPPAGEARPRDRSGPRPAAVFDPRRVR